MNEHHRCFDLTSEENRERLGAYDLKTAVYRFCLILGTSPVYVMPDGKEYTNGRELNEKDFKIPALTVQPIVENAVKHGALSRKDGTGKVVVTTENVGQFVRITVADNGIGAAITDKQKQHRNVGLSNARSRIQTQCGGTLTINYGENGTRAVITIPKEGI